MFIVSLKSANRAHVRGIWKRGLRISILMLAARFQADSLLGYGMAHDQTLPFNFCKTESHVFGGGGGMLYQAGENEF